MTEHAAATVTRVCLTEKGPAMVQATVSVSMLAQAVAAESASVSRGAESTWQSLPKLARATVSVQCVIMIVWRAIYNDHGHA